MPHVTRRRQVGETDRLGSALRLLVVSDLAGMPPPHAPMPGDVDVVVAAGDVTDSALDTLQWLRARFPAPTPVVAVLGDREFRGSVRERMLDDARKLARRLRIHLLEDHAVFVDRVRYVGATLWSDFRLHGDPNTAAARAAAGQAFADLGIRNVDGTMFDPLRSTGLHWLSRTWLGLTLTIPHDGPTIVVTHHAPTGHDLPMIPFLDPLAPAHASRCDDLVRHSDATLWIHGGPQAVDHIVGRTRVLSVPHDVRRPVLMPVGMETGEGVDLAGRPKPACEERYRVERSEPARCLAAPIQASLFELDECGVAGRRTGRAGAMPLKLRRAAPVPAADAARLLDTHADYRVLRRVRPRSVEPHYSPKPGECIALLVDVETTGLDHRRDEVIEVGMVAFVHDAEGRIGPVVGVLGMLQEPNGEISPEITRLTGITAEMVAGQAIDTTAVRALVERADLVIAHNAKFDRAFCERLDDAFRHKAWACSVAEVPWREIGFEGAKLAYLVNGCGMFHDGHRAVDDCHALLEVLAHEVDGTSALSHLLRSSRSTRVRVWAEGAPFDRKDVLKARGYRWSGGEDGRPKAWWTEVADRDLAAELLFLERDVRLRAAGLRQDVLTARERYRAN